MAAKLTWSTGYLWLGQLPLAHMRHTGRKGWQWTLTGHGWRSAPSRYETKEDAQQDCESEVRRLLKDAGVDVA